MIQNFCSLVGLLALLLFGACDSSDSSTIDDGGVLRDGGTANTMVVDIGTLSTTDGLRRVSGYTGVGELGAPVAAGVDCDGDSNNDVALASFLAAPFNRSQAGEVYLVFGDGSVSGEIDTAIPSADVLRIAGAGVNETLGNEVWMDDVTGDGVGDLILGRQNFQPDPSRPGAGALTILVGGTSLRTHAESLNYLDLLSPPSSVTITTLIGAAAIDRLGVWFRTADVTGDGVADIIVGADQEDAQGNNSGAVYVIRGGAHLNATQDIDLADFGSTALVGHLAKVVPPADSAGLHLGASCAAADLDGNGRAEVMVSAALNRSGASVDALGAPGGSAESRGGTESGTLFIAWDDNFAGETWASGLTIALDAAPGALTVIDGAERNEVFGEEVIGGVDFDNDGKADLFVGDLVGDFAADDRGGSGVGHVLYDAASLKGLSFSMDDLPDGLNTTTILGAEAGVISSDTSMVGDFDGDGIADLGTGSPKAEALGREIAGTIHILFGKTGRWPEFVDLSNVEAIAQEDVRITAIVGANGTLGEDRGDMICYSGVAADMDGDGRHEVITNEMLGNGVDPLAIDVGNLVVISGTELGTAPE